MKLARNPLISWLETAPPGTSVPVESLRPLLEEAEETEPERTGSETPHPSVSWRERLWLVPAETRIGVLEMAEAAGRSKSWVYRHTSRKSGLPLLPHRKLDGELVFVAGEVRRWLEANEEVIESLQAPVLPVRRRA